MEFYGDVLITEGEIGGNIQYENGQPVMDGGMDSFIYISLFSNDYWGNEIVNSDAEKLEEGLDFILRNKVTSQTGLSIIDRLNNLLQPMIDIGLADQIENIDVFLDVNQMKLTFDVLKGGITNNYKYIITWNNQLTNPAINRV